MSRTSSVVKPLSDSYYAPSQPGVRVGPSFPTVVAGHCSYHSSQPHLERRSALLSSQSAFHSQAAGPRMLPLQLLCGQYNDWWTSRELTWEAGCLRRQHTASRGQCGLNHPVSSLGRLSHGPFCPSMCVYREGRLMLVCPVRLTDPGLQVKMIACILFPRLRTYSVAQMPAKSINDRSRPRAPVANVKPSRNTNSRHQRACAG